MSAGLVSQFKEATQSARATLRPWGKLLEPTALSLPSSLSDATTRLAQNLTHFRSNYALFALIMLFLSLLYHSFKAIREQIFGSNESTENPALMNGFAQQAESMGEGMARTVMSGFKPEVLPVYTGLANEFAVFDRWFASVPASTQPNRFYVHSATSHGAMSNVRKDLIHGFPQKTIFDYLDENGLDFGIYYQNIPATLFFNSLRKLKHVLKFHSYALTFKLHARLGKPPILHHCLRRVARALLLA